MGAGTEYANLVLRVDSLEASRATSELDKLSRSGRRAEKATDGLSSGSRKMGSSLKGAIAPLLTITAALAGLRAIKDSAVEFGVLDAQLQTATGSAENAALAFKEIQSFATQTPYDLQQATKGFTQLVNLGLDPSRRALESYGNTASAMGKDLGQFIEAVADASTGEFERLKEFGIKARKQGDDIALTFRGKTEVIGNSASEIEGYLISLGENEFAGAMERQMDTLGGAISNFEDSWSKAVLAVSNAGASDIMERAFRGATSGLEEFTSRLNSGQAQAETQAFFGQFEPFLDDLVTGFSSAGLDLNGTITKIKDFWKARFTEMGLDGENAKDTIKEAFSTLPTNLRFVAQRMGIELSYLIEQSKIIASAVGEAFAIEFNLMVEKAKITGRQIADALNVFNGDDFDFGAAIDEANSQALAKYGEIGKEVATQQKIQQDLRQSSIEQIKEERDAAISRYQDEISAAKELRTEYDKLNEGDSTEDILSRFRTGGGDNPSSSGAGGTSSGGSSSSNAKAEAAAREFDQLVESLRTEEEAIQSSYDRRSEIIRNNTESGSEYQLELMGRLSEQYEDDSLRRIEYEQNYSQSLYDILAEQEEVISASYERRRNAINASESLSQEERLTLLTQAEQRYSTQQEQITAQRHEANLGAAENFFGNLSALSRSENSKLAAIGKAAAIAQATIDTYRAANSAYASLSGIPYVGPALGAAAAAAAIAAGIANVNQIRSQDYAGGFERGGMIPAGQVGLLEGAPEFVKGPAVVTSQRTTRDLLQGSSNSQGSSGSSPTINIYNNNSSESEVTAKTSDDGRQIEIIVNRVKNEIAGEVRSGNGVVSESFEESYGVKRGVV